MSDTEQPAGEKPAYQHTGAPGPGSPEYEAMDQLATMFERLVDELRGGGNAPGTTS